MEIGELVDLGLKAKVFEKSGAWYSYQGKQFAQGREKVKKELEANPQLMEEVDRTIREKMKVNSELLSIPEESEDVGADKVKENDPDI